MPEKKKDTRTTLVPVKDNEFAEVPSLAVAVVDSDRGLYQVATSKAPTKPRSGYSVNILAPTCTCNAGLHGFDNCKTYGVCKHVLLARSFARNLAEEVEGVAQSDLPGERAPQQSLSIKGVGAIQLGLFDKEPKAFVTRSVPVPPRSKRPTGVKEAKIFEIGPHLQKFIDEHERRMHPLAERATDEFI